MVRTGLFLAAALLAVSAPVFGAGAERRSAEAAVEIPAEPEVERLSPLAPRARNSLSITIESGIQFSKLALRGQQDGDAEIDPQTGEKRVGPGMIDLGGLAFQGQARVTGEPLQPIRIDLPHRVVLRSPDGARAELTDFRTDLPAVAMLDERGELTFNFGARISSQKAMGGNFRGRIPIRVEYF
jgi:hypothetical protein